MKRKILIINNSSRISGAEASLLTFLNGYDTAKYTVTLMIPAGGELARMASNCTLKTGRLRRFRQNADLFSLLSNIASLIATTLQLAILVWKENIDVIYANSYQSQLYACALKLLVWRKSIWHVRDNVNNIFLAKLFARCSTRIICISKHIYDQVPAAYAKKHLVYNGIDPDEWRPRHPVNGDRALSAALGVASSTRLVGCVGQLIPWKKSHDLIEVAGKVIQEYPQVHFVVIGEDLFEENSRYTEEFKKKIRQNRLEPYFTFLGYKENVADYVNQLDVLVHLAHAEPFGRVLIEAMALEKPVVAVRGGGTGEIITNGTNGFLAQPGDLAMFSAHVVTLLKDAGLRQLFGSNGRREVIARFSVADNVKKIEEIIDGI